MATFSKNSLNLDYSYLKKDSTKPTVVLIHGFGLDKRIWDSQVEYLSAKGFNILTYDMRGFGKSTIPDSPYTHHGDLNDLMTELGIKKAHLIGMSFGGEIAIDMALENSEKVGSLTLLGSSVGGYDGDPNSPLGRWMELKKRGDEESIKKIREEMAEHDSLSHLSEEDRKMVVRQMSEYSLWHLDGNDPRIIPKKERSALKRLKEIYCPVSIMVGEEDSEHQKEIAERLDNEIPNSTLSVLEGTGHFINLEAEGKFNSWLDEGLQKELNVEDETEKVAEQRAGIRMV